MLVRSTGTLVLGIVIVLASLATDTPAAAAAPRTLIVQPDQGRAPVLHALAGARVSIDLIIYALTDKPMIEALLEAHRRGVRVRVLYNMWSFLRMGRPSENEPAANALRAQGIPAKPARRCFAVTHQKTFVIDGGTAIVMTFNLGPSYFGGTRDFGVVTTDPAQVAEIRTVFDDDWYAREAKPAEPSLVWSPVNARERTEGIIAGARHTLEVYNEELRDARCLQALSDAARRGVVVRVIAAQLSSHGGKDGNAAGRQELQAAGVDVKEGLALYAHAKMILADAGAPGARAFVGSQNFSTTSLDQNRELGLILTEPDLLATLRSTFESDWLTPTPEQPPVTPSSHALPAPTPTTAPVNATPAPAKRWPGDWRRSPAYR